MKKKKPLRCRKCKGKIIKGEGLLPIYGISPRDNASKEWNRDSYILVGYRLGVCLKCKDCGHSFFVQN